MPASTMANSTLADLGPGERGEGYDPDLVIHLQLGVYPG